MAAISAWRDEFILPGWPFRAGWFTSQARAHLALGLDDDKAFQIQELIGRRVADLVRRPSKEPSMNDLARKSAETNNQPLTVIESR